MVAGLVSRMVDRILDLVPSSRMTGEVKGVWTDSLFAWKCKCDVGDTYDRGRDGWMEEWNWEEIRFGFQVDLLRSNE